MGGDVTEGHAYAHICSRSQLEPLEHKQPHLVVCFFFSLVCKGGKTNKHLSFFVNGALDGESLEEFCICESTGGSQAEPWCSSEVTVR